MSGAEVGGPGGHGDDVVVDARGLRCPTPVIRLARAARDAAPGTVLAVWWTDPAARHDIPAWARMRGHDVLDTAVLDTAELDTADPDPGPAGAAAWSTRVRLGG